MNSVARWILCGLFIAAMVAWGTTTLADDPVEYTWTGAATDGLWITPGNWGLSDYYPGKIIDEEPEVPDHVLFSGDSTGRNLVDIVGLNLFEIWLGQLKFDSTVLGGYTIRDTTAPEATQQSIVLQSIVQQAGNNTISTAEIGRAHV